MAKVLQHVQEHLGASLDEDLLIVLPVICQLLQHKVRMQRRSWVVKLFVDRPANIEDHRLWATLTLACCVVMGCLHGFVQTSLDLEQQSQDTSLLLP